MAQVVAFPAFVPRTDPAARRASRKDGDGRFGKVIVFTGVWHEQTGRKDAAEGPEEASEPKQ